LDNLLGDLLISLHTGRFLGQNSKMETFCIKNVKEKNLKKFNAKIPK
jgi:hypothetical protein